MIEQPMCWINEDGDKVWYLLSKGKSYWHRLGGPAIIGINGEEDWWEDNRRHRTDGPAVTYQNGDKSWWINDERHRTDGPATENVDGTREWWINGGNITKEVEEWIEKYKIDMNTDEGKMRFKLTWT